jgi:hypothetical protein
MGFTEDETKGLCESHGVDFNQIREWYDGYVLRGIHIYAPISVLSALRKGFGSHWTETEEYETLKSYIEMGFDGLKEAIIHLYKDKAARRRVNATKYLKDLSFLGTADDIFALLAHLGYLGYDERESEVFIPNKEIWLCGKSSLRIHGA